MRKLSRWIPVIGVVAAAVVVGVILANQNHTRTVTTTVVQTASGTAQPTSFSQSGSGKSINQIYQQDGPGVVDILVKSKAQGSGSSLFGNTGSSVQEGEGAGVVYNDRGYILTDEHVIDNATDVVVTFEDGVKVKAKVIGSDPSSDVGVIKVDVASSELHPIAFANSDSARVGDPVVAIGSPFSLPETVTSGIVSQTGRAIEAPNQYQIPGAIQTDAAINPGNSGGPLLNADGQVLGLNDQIETDETNTSTGQGQSAGIGFATPANEDVKVANEIIAGKSVQHAYLGIAESKSEEADVFSTHASKGVAIGEVKAGGPAAKAGLQVNDVIEKIGNTSIASFDQLVSVLNEDDPGQKVPMTIDRNGQIKHVTVTLGNRPYTAPTEQ